MAATALVVGGNRGIGRQVVLQLAAAGWSVCAASRTGAQQVASAAAEAGLAVRAATVDVCDAGSVSSLRAEWESVHSGLDALVVTAGTAVAGRMADITPDDVERMLREHVVGAYRVVRAFRPQLASNRGHVVLLLSRMGRRPGEFGHAYGTAKAALAHLAGCLAADMAAAGVRVNCVSPGAVDTDLLRGALPERAATALRPDEVARVIVQLVGKDFASVNNTVIDIAPASPA